MKKHTTAILATSIILSLALTACCSDDKPATQAAAVNLPSPFPGSPLTSPADAYRMALQDAAVVVPGKIADNLFAISKDNPKLVWNADKTRVLLVTWKSPENYEKNLRDKTQTSDQDKYVVWVSAAPQLQEFCHNYLRNNPTASEADLELRLKQYLGMGPDWKMGLFVELWVDPNDLIRPCVDPDISDSGCQLNFDDNNPPQVARIADYRVFYKNLYYSSFRSPQSMAPWTGLGYTYDWGNPLTKQGASEYIIKPSSPYTINKTATTMAYCK